MRSRALLAIGLSVGFYVLSIGVSILLLGIAYYMVVHSQWRLGKIVIACLIGAFTILRSILPTRERFEQPGPRLSNTDAPLLFDQIQDVARQTGQELPSEVYLIPDVNAWVVQRGSFLGVGGHRVLAIGYPLLQSMSVSQIRAVLAHEFGHFCAADTKLSPLIYRTTKSVGRTLHALHEANSHVHFLFEWYGDLYVRITRKISRRQELLADELAAKVAGKQPAIQALQTLHRVAVPAELFWQEVGPVVSAGWKPRLSEGLRQFFAQPSMQDFMSAQMAEQNETADVYDTHPPLSERLRSLEQLTFPVGATNEEPASTLLADFDAVEGQLLSFMYGCGKDMKPLDWKSVGVEVYIPLWKSWMQSQHTALESLAIDKLPEAFAPDSLFLRKYVDPPGTVLTRQDRRMRARAVLSGALAVALFAKGWELDCSPGICELRLGNHVVDPFRALTAIVEGKTTPEEWKRLCSEMGIAGERLVNRTVPAGA